MMNIKNYYIDIDEIPWFPSWIKTIISLVKLPFLFHSRYISRHFVVDVIWRLPVWNVTIRCYLASCTLQFGSNLTKIIFQGKHFNYFIVVGWWRHAFWSDTHYSISLRYTRNRLTIACLNLLDIETEKDRERLICRWRSLVLTFLIGRAIFSYKYWEKSFPVCSENPLYQIKVTIL